MTRRFELKGLLFTAFPPLEAEESGNTPVENQKEEKNSFPQRVYNVDTEQAKKGGMREWQHTARTS